MKTDSGQFPRNCNTGESSFVYACIASPVAMASGSDDATEQREIKYDRKECVRLLYLAFLRKNERSRNKNEEIKSVAQAESEHFTIEAKMRQ